MPAIEVPETPEDDLVRRTDEVLFVRVLKVRERLGLVSITDLFRKKATHRGLDPATFAEKFEKRVHDYEGRWDEELSQYLGQVPHFDGVERNVRRALRKAGLI